MIRRGIFLCITAMLAASAAFAQVDNNGGAACVQAGSQLGAKSATDGVGGVFVVWQDYRRGEWDIYAQHLNANGVPTWAYGGIPICTGAGSQANVAVIADAQGGMIATWEDARTGGAAIYAQRVSASGVYTWAFNGVPVTTAPATQNARSVVADGTGGAIMAWQDYRMGPSYIYTQRISGSGTPLWTLDGVRLCSASSTQMYPLAVSDSTGGALIVWQDSRTGSQDIYGQRVNGSGSLQWTSNGVPVCSASSDQTSPVAVADAVGGIIVAWQDQRAGGSIHAQRVNSTGVTLWATDGVALVAATGASAPTIATDGANGAIVAWQDQRNSGSLSVDLYAQHIGAAGIPLWTGNGVVVCEAISAQYGPSAVSDGAGGLIVSWYDARTGSNEVYSQRVNEFGARRWFGDGLQLTSVPASNQWYTLTTSDGNGGAFVLWQDDRYTTAPDVFIQHLSSTGAMLIADAEAPRIASVRDVPNDQGGRVKVSWTASIQDLSPFYRVSEYRIWRSVPDHALLGLASAELRQTQVGAATYYWELIGTQSSGHFYNYSLVAPTTSDSVAGSNPRTAFMIEARTATGDAWWDSSPDSGYSVDNLAPGAPAGLVAVVEPSSGGTALHWLPSPESDVLQYRIYVGESSDFAPSVKSWIATVSDTGFVDMTRKYAYYRVTTTDIHGNEGASSLAQNAPVTDVGAGAAARMWLGAASPSPFFDRTSIRFGLASAGRVRLAVFDLGGREVASLVDREMGAGEHSVMWDGHGNGAKPALAGMYFYRLEVAGKVLTSRVVRMR